MKEDKELRDRFLEEFSYHHGHYKHKINYKTQGGDIVEFWEDCVPKEVLDFIESEKEKSYEEGVIKGRLEALPIIREMAFTKKELEKFEDMFWKKMHGRIYYDDYETVTIKEGYLEELVRFIKRLLSEEAFTDKELEIIDWYLQEYGTPEGVDKEADKLREKVSKLLKRKK